MLLALELTFENSLSYGRIGPEIIRVQADVPDDLLRRLSGTGVFVAQQMHQVTCVISPSFAQFPSPFFCPLIQNLLSGKAR